MDKWLQVTPEEIFLRRREFMKGSLGWLLSSQVGLSLISAKAWGKFTQGKRNTKFTFNEKTHPITDEKHATTYNNFYEFGLDKDQPHKLVTSWNLNPDNWKVEILGLTNSAKKSFSLDELIELGGGQEERVYRFRCVEAWSMVVPWTGFSLAELIKKLKPKSSAKYIKLTSHADPKDFPNIKYLSSYPWPYTEGLTIEEANHPLTFIATGLYGKPLPKQNGAPLRLVVPWKYGFKSIKSIVKIEFTEQKPATLWNQLASSEYGFYANVNPEVPHPRWSQASERILDGKLFPSRRDTLKFNGYGDEVASLYTGLDLKKNF